MIAATATTVLIPAQPAPAEPVPSGPDPLTVRALLASDDAAASARAGLALVRRVLGLNHAQAVQAIRAVVMAFPGDPVAAEYGRLIGIADARIRGVPASGDPWQFDQETDAVVEAHYRGRGLR